MSTKPGTDLDGMQRVDISGNARVPIVMEMVGALSRASDPHDVLRSFSEGLRKLHGPRGYVSLSTRGLEPGAYRITRIVLDDDMNDIDQGDPWRDGDKIPVHTDGFFAEIVRHEQPHLIHNFFLRDDPVVGNQLSEYGSMLAIPLFDNGRALNWAIMLKREPDGHDEQELEETILRANLVGASVRNVIAAQELRTANDRAEREVDQIARIQQALLPPTLPEIPGVQIGVSFETFDRAGGDLYDVIPLRRLGEDRTPDPNGAWAIHIADAAGHGPAASTIVAMLNAILHASPEAAKGPGAQLTFANHHLYRKRLDGTFVTAILARYDPTSRRLTYARAGHNPLILMKCEGDSPIMERLDGVGGVPLGVVDSMEYEEETIQLRPGQTVVFYTDGITEAMAPDGAMFEVNGIERSLTECSGKPDCVIGHITSALLDHEGGRRPGDDQTLLVLRVDDESD